MPTTIRVIDSVMGSGKTSAMINLINETGPEQKFVFITPLLSECDRIVEACAAKNFKAPSEFGTKLNGFKWLLKKGANIVTTHALYKHFDQEIVDILKDSHYTLVVDEAIDEFDDESCNAADFAAALQAGAIAVEDEVVSWTGTFTGTAFNFLKEICPAKIVSYGKIYTFIPLLRQHLYESFDSVYIMTFMFGAQSLSCFFNLMGFEVERFHAERINGRYTIVPGRGHVDGARYRALIELHGDERKGSKYAYNDIPFSYTGLMRLSRQAKCQDEKALNALAEIRKGAYNHFRRTCNCKSADALWTTFKDVRNDVKGRGYSTGFEVINCKGTNIHSHTHSVAYIADIHLNPFLKRYFYINHVHQDEDAYALSSMLQFIWRSAIRNGEPIKLFVPSRRMRCLLKQWLNDPNAQVRYRKDMREPKLITA